MMQEVVRNFRGRNTTIYLVKEGKLFSTLHQVGRSQFA